ncbi:MAG: Ldh family oxidoreductase [Chloroflexi bacterium]|nr:Ldh family oxidoreductase [Chloroflexota bacterium]
MLTMSAEALSEVTTRIFRAAGAPDDVASLVAYSLVDANLAGHDSHGVIRIPTYIEQIAEGDLVPSARPRIEGDRAGLITVDGAWAFGQYAAHVCMDLASSRAKEQHVAIVTLVRANHIGRLGEWAEEAARAGVVGMVATSWGGGPYAATPYGGAGKVLSTNPIAFGIPLGEGPPFVLDYATTAVAEGKLRVARAKQAKVPDGWIVDKDGRPTNEPEDFYAGGMLLPFGGHKGYALAMVVELLSVALTGADAARDDKGRRNGAVFLAIDPSAVRPLDEFRRAATEINARVTGVPPAPGFDSVLIPGEVEARSREVRRTEGIPVAESTWEAIQAAGQSVGAHISV